MPNPSGLGLAVRVGVRVIWVRVSCFLLGLGLLGLGLAAFSIITNYAIKLTFFVEFPHKCWVFLRVSSDISERDYRGFFKRRALFFYFIFIRLT